MTAAPDMSAYAEALRARDAVLDVARGIAMVLVVFGHALHGVYATGHDSYAMRLIMTIVYTSHIPLFFLASGMLAHKTVERPLPEFLSSLWQKVIWPYLVWALILLTLLFVLRGHTNTELAGYQPLSILWRAPAVLWFLYVLAIGMVVLRALARHSMDMVLGIGLACLLVPYGWEEFPQKARYLGMFLIGASVGQTILYSGLTPAGMMRPAVVMALTLLYASGVAQDPIIGYPAYAAPYIPALFAGPALIYAFSHHLVAAGWGNLLARIGRNTMAIFVTHILLTAGARIVLLQLGVTDWWMIILCGTYAGVLLPLLAAEYARRRGVSGYLGWA